MKTRRVYCWRVGWVFEVEEGNPCPECSCDNHRVHEGNTCGGFVQSRTKAGVGFVRDTGHPCELPIDHTGQCEYDLQYLIRTVMES